MDKSIDWIDTQDRVRGQVTLERAHKEGLLHRIAVVYLTNDEGQILVQERADGRLDHSAAGHVDAGESYLEAGLRELKEELGVDGVVLREVGECESVDDDKGVVKHKFKIFSCKATPGTLDPLEVTRVFWQNPEDVWNDMKKKPESKKYCRGFRSTLAQYLK